MFWSARGSSSQLNWGVTAVDDSSPSLSILIGGNCGNPWVFPAPEFVAGVKCKTQITYFAKNNRFPA